MNKTAQAAINRLKTRYKDDQEALEVIERAQADIEYIEAKEAAGGYKGQTVSGKLEELEAFLHDWY